MKILVVLITLTLFACNQKEKIETEEPASNPPIEQVKDKKSIKACTKDLKICPDGTGVGREASNDCKFRDCPEESVSKSGKYSPEVMCPKDVKQCEDGSWVGRDSKKNCAFRACPNESSNKNKKLDSVMMCPKDAKQCADGSWVGRDSKNQCKFHECPTGDKPSS